MAIRLVTHRDGGSAADVTAIVKRMKETATRHGAENFELATEIAGPNAGQWILVITFSDWTAYGKAMATAMAEPEVQQTLAELDKIAKVTSRRLVAEITV